MLKLNGQPRQDLEATRIIGCSQKIREEKEMSTQAIKIQYQGETLQNSTNDIKEIVEMKNGANINKVNNWFSNNLMGKTSRRMIASVATVVIPVLAMGCLVLTALILPYGTATADEPARVLSLGYGVVEDMNINAQLLNASAKLSPVGYGSLTDVAAPRKIEPRGFYSYGMDFVTENVDARSAIENSGFDPKDVVFIAAMTKNTREYTGFDSLDDVVTLAKVKPQGFGAIDDWAKVTPRGFGSLDDMGAERR